MRRLGSKRSTGGLPERVCSVSGICSHATPNVTNPATRLVQHATRTKNPDLWKTADDRHPTPTTPHPPPPGRPRRTRDGHRARRRRGDPDRHAGSGSPVRPRRRQGRPLPRRTGPGSVCAGHRPRRRSEHGARGPGPRRDRHVGRADDARTTERAADPGSEPTPVPDPTATPLPTPPREALDYDSIKNHDGGLRPRAGDHVVRVGRRPDGHRHARQGRHVEPFPA